MDFASSVLLLSKWRELYGNLYLVWSRFLCTLYREIRQVFIAHAIDISENGEMSTFERINTDFERFRERRFAFPSSYRNPANPRMSMTDYYQSRSMSH